jgi:tetratricopeptide (TPR) repeat protein
LLTLTSAGHEYHAENFAFMGHWEAALEHARIDREIGEKTGLLDRVAWGGLSIMWACRGLGRLGEAVEAGRQSLEMAEASGDRRLAILASAELANAMADLGQLDEAAAFAGRSAELASQLHQAYMTCQALDAQAYLCGLRGDWAAALQARQRVVEAAADTDNRLIPMANGPELAEAYFELGQPDHAGQPLESALRIARESDSAIPEARALRVRGRIRAAQGDWGGAQADFGRGVELCEQWKDRLLLARTLLDWGQLQAQRESGEAARKTLARALGIFSECGAQPWVKRTKRALQGLAAER